MADWVNGANDNENDQNQQQTSASKTAAIISKPPSVSITTEAPQTETTSQPLTTSSGPKGSVSQPHKVRLLRQTHNRNWSLPTLYRLSTYHLRLLLLQS